MTSSHRTWRSLSSSSLPASLLCITGLKGLEEDEETEEPLLECRSFAEVGDEKEDNDDNIIREEEEDRRNRDEKVGD